MLDGFDDEKVLGPIYGTDNDFNDGVLDIFLEGLPEDSDNVDYNSPVRVTTDNSSEGSSNNREDKSSGRVPDDTDDQLELGNCGRHQMVVQV